MSSQAEVAYNNARTLLNDDSNILFTDTVLAPKMYQAHRELQNKLRAADAQVMRKLYQGIVAIGATVVTTPPTDIVEPIKLWEKQDGSAISSYAVMSEQDPLDPTYTSSGITLKYWQWADEVLTFPPGSTVAIDVNILYWRLITVPVISTDLIGITNGELWLAPRIAALMAGSLGDADTYKVCTDIASSNLNDVIVANKGRINRTGKP